MHMFESTHSAIVLRYGTSETILCVHTYPKAFMTLCTLRVRIVRSECLAMEYGMRE